MTSNSFNYTLLAIPAYYVFSIVPHQYAKYLLRSNGYHPNNANPKASVTASAIQGKVPEMVFQKFQRAESAQSNNHEQMALFSAAILASLIADKFASIGVTPGASTVESTNVAEFIQAWFAVRTIYNVCYIQISDHTTSFLRSATYFVGCGLAFYQIYKAAQLLG